MPLVAAAVLPTVDWATRPTEDTPQGGMEPLRPSPRGLEAGRHDAGELDAGVLHQGGGELRGTHLGQFPAPSCPKRATTFPDVSESRHAVAVLEAGGSHSEDSHQS